MINSFSVNPLRSKDITKKAAITLGLLVLILTPVFLNPVEVGLPSCYFKAATGYSCPSCGMTRSIYAVSHLRIQESANYHLMGPLFYGVFLIMFFKFSFETISRKEIRLKVDPLIKRISLLTLFFFWSGFWVIRFFGEI